MRAMKMASAVGCSALLLSTLAAASGAQESTRERAPTIRVYSTNGSYVLHTTSYVTPVIEVGENAYVFAISMDLDGQIQVLQPDFPGLSVRVQARRQLKLPSFFTGFGPRNDADGYGYTYSTAGYSRYDNTYANGFPDARGTVIALASRAPFNLERIESNGDWNMSAIRRLIETRGPESAAQSLASYLGAKGEPIGWDFMRFAGDRPYNNAYAYGSYNSCDLYGFSYAPTLASRYFQTSNIIAALRSRGQRAVVGYDICGFPYVIVRGSNVGGGFPGVRPPRNPGDTSSIFPKSKRPDGTPRHPPLASGAAGAPQGIFPLPQREGHMGDVTITAPKGRRAEPGQILNGYRPSPVGSAPGRIPIERVSTPRLEPATSQGTQQTVRESRPEGRSAPPPPSRVPDAAPRYTPPPAPPAPVVREAPSSPPPARSEPLQPAPARRP